MAADKDSKPVKPENPEPTVEIPVGSGIPGQPENPEPTVEIPVGSGIPGQPAPSMRDEKE